jgi:hypothetical protein
MLIPSTALSPLLNCFFRSIIFKNLRFFSKVYNVISGGSKLSGAIYFVSKVKKS